MEACVAVEDELNKVLAKFGELDKRTQSQLSDLLARVQAVTAELRTGCESALAPADTIARALALVDQVHAVTNRAAACHRELHSTVSKVGKAVDRHFLADYSLAAVDASFLTDGRHLQLVNEAIHRHLLQTGRAGLAGRLAEAAAESGGALCRAPSEATSSLSAAAEQFSTINSVVDALLQEQLQPALLWLQPHSCRLHALDSLLEFRVRRLHFLTLIEQRRPLEAVHEARAHLGPFCAAYDGRPRPCSGEAGPPPLLHQLRRLMGALAYAHVGVQRSPYARLAARGEWLEVAELFVQEAYRLYGVRADSPLHVVLTAGCKAAPLLANMRRAMRHGQVGGVMWGGGGVTVTGGAATVASEHLPVEVDIDRHYCYHSLFACPILKQQSTETNPPVRLICGHCISKDALQRLSHGSKLKCPYCPVEMNASDARLVQF